MKIKTDINLYFSGSGLTRDRCQDFVQLYEIAHSAFDGEYSYKELQEKSTELGGPGASAIRTLIPLFKLMGFVDYSKASIFRFTDDGKVFYYLEKSIIELEQSEIQQRELIIDYLCEAQRKLFWKGFMNLLQSDDENGYKFRIAYYLFDSLGEIEWNEYLYSLYLVLGKENHSIPDAIRILKKNRGSKITYEINAKGRDGNYAPVATTATSYLKSILETAGLIENTDKQNSSRVTEKFSDFKSFINS